jgi:hypothetical protein
MSTPSPLRRSSRVRAQPESYADQQAAYTLHAIEQAEVRRARQESLSFDHTDTSDEEGLGEAEVSSSEEEEEGKENIPPQSAWSRHTTAVHLPYYNIPVETKLPRHHDTSVLGYVQCFLTRELVSTIATNTNLYAVSKQAPAGWTTSTEEVWRFIAARIFMGIIDLPYLHMYWEEEWRQAYVVRLFSQHRFAELTRYFHVAAPTPRGVRHTVIDKVRPLYEACQANFFEYFVPPRYLTVDEMMIRFEGRDHWVRRIKGKPTPEGFKVWGLAAESYLLAFQVHKPTARRANTHGAIHHIVMQLIHPYRGTNRILFMDNLFTSPALARHLFKEGIRCCGTTRTNRKGLPSGVGGLEKGQTAVWQSGVLGCRAFREKQKVVCMLSTHCKVDDMVTIPQQRDDNLPSSITKPLVVHDYNLHKSHVDRVDQLRSYYAIERKSMKNWPPLAWWLVDMCITNAYALWRRDTKSEDSQLVFRKELLRQLAAAYPPPHSHEEPAVPPHSTRPAAGHWPKHAHKKRKCVVCTRGRAGGSQSEIECEQCGVHLCLAPCFKQYHTEKD